MIPLLRRIADWVRRQYWRLRLTPTAIAIQVRINKVIQLGAPILGIRPLVSRAFGYARDIGFIATAIYAGFFYVPAYELPVAAVERRSTPIPWTIDDSGHYFVTTYDVIKFDDPIYSDRIGVRQEHQGTFFVVEQSGWYTFSVRFLQPSSRKFENALMNYYRLNKVRPVIIGSDKPNTIATGPGYARGWETNVIGFDYKCLEKGEVVAFTFGMAIPRTDPNASVAPSIPATIRIALANPPKDQSYWEKASRWAKQQFNRDQSSRTPTCI